MTLAEPRSATFWFRDSFLGRGPLTFARFDIAESKAYFCPHCGEIWARVVIPGAPFWALHAPCEKHTSEHTSQVPGSMWLIWDRAFNDSMPQAALIREVALHIRHFDRLQSLEKELA